MFFAATGRRSAQVLVGVDEIVHRYAEVSGDGEQRVQIGLVHAADVLAHRLLFHVERVCERVLRAPVRLYEFFQSLRKAVVHINILHRNGVKVLTYAVTV